MIIPPRLSEVAISANGGVAAIWCEDLDAVGLSMSTAPIVGTDVPVVTIALKAADAFDIDFVNIGQYFATGIAYALTTGAADNDTGALTLADVTGLNIWYA